MNFHAKESRLPRERGSSSKSLVTGPSNGQLRGQRGRKSEREKVSGGARKGGREEGEK
jgi:hypothetical protein